MRGTAGQHTNEEAHFCKAFEKQASSADSSHAMMRNRVGEAPAENQPHWTDLEGEDVMSLGVVEETVCVAEELLHNTV